MANSPALWHTRGLRLAVALILLMTLGACTTKVAYNFMHWAIEWKVQRLVSLHDEQKFHTKEAIKEFHIWHRTTQLPLYAEYLRQLQERLRQTPLTAQDIHAETDKIQVLIDQSVNKVLPDAAKVLATLSDKQVQELLARVAEEREEYREEHVDISAKKQAKKRYKDFLKYFGDWIGNLSSAQKQQIQQWSEALEPYEKLNHAQQKIWEENLAEILAQRDDQEALLAGLRALMFHRTDNWQPELEAIMDRNQERTYALLADLLNNLNDKQTAHLHNKLDEYQKIFMELSRERQ